MIAPLINEWHTIQQNQDDKNINQQINNSQNLIIKKSNYIQTNLNHQHEINNQNEQINKITKKTICIKTNSIKYHSFSHNTNKKNLSISLSNIVNHDNNDNFQMKNYNDSQFESKIMNKNHKFKFTENEDKMLTSLVDQHGAKNWKFISSFMPGRNTKQCRDRYVNYLSPKINRSKWEEKDDRLLLEKYKIHGPKWSLMTQFFPNRTANDIKNRFKYTICRKIHLFYQK